ncbi:hypothetical protein SeMB42_g01572 [Synchytrium endobioticum]|uniref:Bystin n=1 Tax=Synchytrium endobioticum TaxID=286115 RepID=A0A507DDY5_9FUNG|nr:hypothetical protein SeLEV6574_g01457 [Synchytrium endobioticum]TPX52245.1 hypothetical protein SeMB42_g01572 [Synchytrium endobioticum]
MPVQKTTRKSLPSRHNPVLTARKARLPHPDHERPSLSQETSLEAYHLSKAARKHESHVDIADDDADDAHEQVVDTKTSRRILQLAREQQDEVEATGTNKQNNRRSTDVLHRKQKKQPVILESDDDDDDDEGNQFDHDEMDFDGMEAQLGINEADKAILEKFMNREQPNRQLMLADAVLEKIKFAQPNNTSAETIAAKLNSKVVEVYTKVGMILSRYRSGKLPKTFKIIPTLSDWEDILLLTNPEKWTPHATYQATRIFSSNLKANLAQRFYSVFLLDKVRTEISETKKLNVHLYNALKKALYKPAAFFKGFLLPLCESGDCTLREAVIVGSVLTKVSIPTLQSAACLLKLAEMEYSGANSIFIRILVDKKYALPYKVLDALVFHFIKFTRTEAEMPVLWHQSLLVFVQRYKNDLTDEQKESLLELIRIKTHYAVSYEIRRELTGQT